MGTFNDRSRSHLWQGGRSFAALSPDKARIDDRSIIDMAALLVGRARSSSSQPADCDLMYTGDVARGIAADVTFLLATIACTDARREYKASWSALFPQPDADALRPLVLASLRRLAEWHGSLVLVAARASVSSPVNAFLRDFEDIVRGRNARTVMDLSVLIGRLARDPAWADSIGAIMDDPLWRSADPPVTGPVDANELAQIHSAFNGATGELAVRGREAVVRTFTGFSDHEPHAGLMLAFLVLARQVQGRLNAITDRHLTFYYQTVLRLAPAPAIPDRAMVAFDLAPQAHALTLPAGTRLGAGNDALGRPVLFATDRPILVSHASVRAMKAIRVRLVPIAPTIASDGIRAMTAEVGEMNAYPVVNSKDGHGLPLDTPEIGWPAFGAGRCSVPSKIGVSIRSTLLRLSEGDRRVTIVLAMLDPIAASLAVDAYLARSRETRGSKAPPMPEVDVSSCFRVEVSTADGFVGVPQTTRFNRARGTLQVKIHLPPTAPAVAPARRLIPNAATVAEMPSIRFLLDPDARIYGYSYFQDLALRSASVLVTATGLRGVVGDASPEPVAALKPFALFGAAALPGAALVVSHPDLAEKAVTQVSVGVRWSHLPTDGFAPYYADYGRSTDNGSFKVSIAGLVDQAWASLAVDMPLFQGGTDGSLQSRSSFSVATRGIWAASEASSATARFVRMQLSAPDYGFGQTIYPTVLGRAMKAATAVDDADAPATPNPPYVPVVEALTIDYRCTETLVLAERGMDPASNAGVYLVEPFGSEVPFQTSALLPPIPAQGYLFLGLAGLDESGDVSLLIDIQPRAADLCVGRPAGSLARGRRAPAIHCLSDDRWVPLTEANVQSDETEGLGRPGILSLQLPPLQPNQGRAFDRTLTWLRFVADGDPATYGRMLGITCNGVTATRILDAVPTGPNDITATSLVLPSGSIKGLVGKSAAITAIHQPLASSDGMPAESIERFRVRVSERLRHRNRAIQTRDYEAMVLERFPTIGDAKCHGVRNGGVGLIVAPLRIQGVDTTTPRVPEYQLQAIADYLLGRAPSGVRRLTVRNPAYEPVRIIAWVEITPGDANAKVRMLRAAIDRFVAPWLGAPDRPMAIGTPHIDLSSLRDTLVRQPFLRTITGLSMTHLFARTRVGAEFRDDGTGESRLFVALHDSARDADRRCHVRPALPHSVLVPAHHEIHVVGLRGIGAARIEDDFVVGGGTAPGSFLRPPRRAGIGNLAIGEDFVVRP